MVIRAKYADHCSQHGFDLVRAESQVALSWEIDQPAVGFPELPIEKRPPSPDWALKLLHLGDRVA